MKPISETNTNFEKSKLVIRALVGMRLTASEYAFCIYLIDQQYGYTKLKGVDGDSAGYGHITKKIGYSIESVKATVKSLTGRQIILKETSATKYGNRYRFNENVEEWHNTIIGVSGRRKGVKKGSKTSATSIAEDPGVVLPAPPPPVSSSTPPVVLPLTPNSKVSSVKNETVNDEAVDDKDSPPAFFRNKNKNEDTGVTDDQLAGYKVLLSKLYPSLDISKEFQLFQCAYQNLKDNRQITDKFTVWVIDAQNEKNNNKGIEAKP